MFGVKDLLDAAPLEVRMIAQNVHEIAPGHAKQYRGAVHVNGNQAVGPSGQSYHSPPPSPNTTTAETPSSTKAPSIFHPVMCITWAP